MIKLVRQEHRFGCVAACVAMVLGYTYFQALEYIRQTEEDVGYSGTTHYLFDQVVALRGYAVARRYRKNIITNTDHVVWPPEPWADAHYCNVMSIPGAPVSHSVIMLADGSCLDPARDRPWQLSEYAEVKSVAAIYKISSLENR